MSDPEPTPTTLDPAVPAPGAGEAPPGAVADARDPPPDVVDRLRLAGTAGLSPRIVARLVRELGSAGAVLRAGASRVAAVPGVGAARAALLAAAPTRDDVLRDLDRARAASATLLVPEAPGWPDALGDLPDPPSVLWVRGDLARALGPPAEGPGATGGVRAALRGRGVAIVGSRRASSYGVAQAERIARDLAALGVPVISGLARGIDAAAHRGAIGGGGPTIGVLGGGLARFYPPEHVPLAREIVARGGAVASEFPLDVPPLPHHFPRRNRLIAALAAAVVVVEAAEASGSLLTADHALDLGREVLAVPGRVDQPNSRGVHRLLREGAAVCESAADVLAALGFEVAAPDDADAGAGAPPRGATAAESAVLAALAEGDLDADAIVAAAGLDAPVVLASLSALEIRGEVGLAADGTYSVCRGRRTRGA